MTALALTLGQVSRRIDPVVGAVAALLALLIAWSPSIALESAQFTLDALVFIAPFILLSVAVAAYAKAAGADQLIARAFSGHLPLMITAAALFGALSPFCSCGVIPLIAALLAMGMPLPAVMAFWIASPVMDPEMFILTAAALGLQLAVAKTLAAIGIGLLGGLATWAIQHRGGFVDPLREGVGTCGGSAVRNPKPVRWAFWQEPSRRSVFNAEALRNGIFLGKWLTLAFLLESLMLRYLPAEAVSTWLGSDQSLAIPSAALIGVPAYLNGYAAIPTTGALLELGMTPGAALAFMVAGAVTSIPAAIAVFALVRRPVFLWYLALAFVGSTAVGFAYQGWLAS
ncbi:MAG: permease [Pseudomonadota bacterium]